jgi:hypothetical protein
VVVVVVVAAAKLKKMKSHKSFDNTRTGVWCVKFGSVMAELLPQQLSNTTRTLDTITFKAAAAVTRSWEETRPLL